MFESKHEQGRTGYGICRMHSYGACVNRDPPASSCAQSPPTASALYDHFPNRKASIVIFDPSAARLCCRCFLFARRDFVHSFACPRVVTVAVAPLRQTAGSMDRNGSRSRRRSSVTVDDDTASRRHNFYRRESNMSESVYIYPSAMPPCRSYL